MGIPDHHLGDAASGGRGLGEMVLGQNGEQFRIDIVASEDSPALHLRAGKGEPQVAAIRPDGKGLVQVFSQEGKSGISVSSVDGQPGAILAMLENLMPMLMLQGSDKRTVVVPQDPLPLRAANRQANIPGDLQAK